MAGAAVAGLLAAVVTAALVLPDAGGDPHLVPAPPADDPPATVSVDDACLDARQTPALPGIQTSAPRSAMAPGDVAQLGLRDRTGTTSRSVVAVVTAPGGDRVQRYADLEATAWTYLDYPSDFPAADTEGLGTYLVRWRDAAGAALACDGFIVGEPASGT